MAVSQDNVLVSSMSLAVVTQRTVRMQGSAVVQPGLCSICNRPSLAHVDRTSPL